MCGVRAGAGAVSRAVRQPPGLEPKVPGALRPVSLRRCANSCLHAFGVTGLALRFVSID